VLYISLTWLKKEFAPEAIPWADAFASASAYTGMWLMARKKVESWYWWIITDIASVPLYYSKGYVFTGFQFIILTILAIAGLQSWKLKSQSAKLPLQ
jgi:nicotinamide mononucleotide transporter